MQERKLEAGLADERLIQNGLAWPRKQHTTESTSQSRPCSLIQKRGASKYVTRRIISNIYNKLIDGQEVIYRNKLAIDSGTEAQLIRQNDPYSYGKIRPSHSGNF